MCSSVDLLCLPSTASLLVMVPSIRFVCYGGSVKCAAVDAVMPRPLGLRYVSSGVGYILFLVSFVRWYILSFFYLHFT